MAPKKDNKTFIATAFMWISAKWKALVAFLGIVVAALTFYLRSKSQKKILEQANKSHKEENEANENAIRDLKTGLDKIRNDEVEEIIESNSKHDKEERELAKKKKAFVDEAKSDDELAKKLADSIGADFVESSKE